MSPVDWHTHSGSQHSSTQLDTARHSSTQLDTARHSSTQLDTAQHRQIECRLSTRPLDTQLNAGRWGVAYPQGLSTQLNTGRWSVAVCRLSTGNRQTGCRLSTRPLNTQARSTLEIDPGLYTHRPLHTQASCRLAYTQRLSTQLNKSRL
jgi:hypothetical protein